VVSSVSRFLATARLLLPLGLTFALPPPALAEASDDNTRNAARNLAEQGKELFDKADFEHARDLFHRAYALVPAPTIALFEARALVKLGRLVEADEAYLRAARTKLERDASEQFRKAISEADEEELALEPRIPKLKIVITGPAAGSAELVVSVDGAPIKAALLGVEMTINPGEHAISASVSGGEPARASFSIRETERRNLELAVSAAKAVAAPTPLAPALAPAGEKTSAPHHKQRGGWQKSAAFAAGGVGVAGLATGVITGVLATSRHSAAERDCPDKVCIEGSPGEDALDSFRTLRTVSTVGYIVAGAGAAAGVTLYLMAPSESSPSSASISVWLSGSSMAVRGAF
jgi:hypothetical protein